MDHALGIQHSQRILKQRNLLGFIVIGLALLVVLLLTMSASRDREIVLQPIAQNPLTISSSGVSRDYLEMVTRDTAQLALNRSPQNLNYWMESLLKIAAPEQHGALKRELMKIVQEQGGSSISQYYTLDSIEVDPDRLVSEVSGTLHTVVGSKSVTSEVKKFRFIWKYSGLSLQLAGFGMVQPRDPNDKEQFS